MLRNSLRFGLRTPAILQNTKIVSVEEFFNLLWPETWCRLLLKFIGQQFHLPFRPQVVGSLRKPIQIGTNGYVVKSFFLAFVFSAVVNNKIYCFNNSFQTILF